MHNEGYIKSLIYELIKQPESELLEFKENNDDKDMIGKNISALSNSAVIYEKESGYLIWGVNDETKEIEGTTFDPDTKKVGNEGFKNWLNRLLSPKTSYFFYSVILDNKRVVVLIVDKTKTSPISFSGKEYVRVGSSTTSLVNNPQLESKLWENINLTSFEEGIAKSNVNAEEVLKLIDYPSYFELLEISLPENREAILDSLKDEDIIKKNDAGNWDITNFGAMLFAKKIASFENLSRKSIRVINYEDNTRFTTIKEQRGGYGYANGFRGLIKYIMDVGLDSKEVIVDGIRKKVSGYPELSIRELVANAVVHQDFKSRGNGPMIEIFDNRIEITNPGKPIIEIDKIINIPPKSRNEKIASMMRRIGICEERGSGMDKIIMETEKYGLNAPIIESGDDYTKVTVFYETNFKSMTTADKIRATYYHCCLASASGNMLTNQSLRKRFKINNSSTISRIIKKTVDKKMIKRFDNETAQRYYKYIPFWK